MPAMSYEQLADRPHAEDPELELLYASGQGQHIDRGVLAPKVRLLTRPLVRDRLLDAVRAAFD